MSTLAHVTLDVNVFDIADDFNEKKCLVGVLKKKTATKKKKKKEKKNQAVAACQWECVGCCTLINRVVYSQLQ